MKNSDINRQTQPIVITGASGRVGNLVAKELLQLGFKVKAVARDVSKLLELKNQGAELAAADFTDTEALINVFTNAQSLFVLSPINLLAKNVNDQQLNNIRSLIEAIRQSGVRNVVLLSSWGAELTEKSGGILGCRFFENELEKIQGINTVILRPVWFMENFTYNISLMKMSGLNGLAINPDIKFPMIATPDIAEVAAEYLSNENFQGKKIVYLKGGREYTMREVTKILGNSIGISEMKYRQFPQAVLKRGMVGSGQLSPDAADMLIEINQGISKGLLKIDTNYETRVTSTSLEDFAKSQFAFAFQQAQKSSLLQKIQGVALRSFLSLAGKSLLKKEQLKVSFS